MIKPYMIIFLLRKLYIVKKEGGPNYWNPLTHIFILILCFINSFIGFSNGFWTTLKEGYDRLIN